MDTLLWIMEICTVLQNFTNSNRDLILFLQPSGILFIFPLCFLVSSLKMVCSGEIMREKLGLRHGALKFHKFWKSCYFTRGQSKPYITRFVAHRFNILKALAHGGCSPICVVDSHIHLSSDICLRASNPRNCCRHSGAQC